MISTCQNPSYWQMPCPLPPLENVLAAEWLWIKPQSFEPSLLPSAFPFVSWQVNVSWLSSENFFPLLHDVWWKTFGKLAVVLCTMQFVLGVGNLIWEDRLRAKEGKNISANKYEESFNKATQCLFWRGEKQHHPNYPNRFVSYFEHRSQTTLFPCNFLSVLSKIGAFVNAV